MTREEIKKKYAAKFEEIELGDTVYLFEQIKIKLTESLYETLRSHAVVGKESEILNDDGTVYKPASISLSMDKHDHNRRCCALEDCIIEKDFVDFMNEYVPAFIERLKNKQKSMIENQPKNVKHKGASMKLGDKYYKITDIMNALTTTTTKNQVWLFPWVIKNQKKMRMGLQI